MISTHFETRRTTDVLEVLQRGPVCVQGWKLFGMQVLDKRLNTLAERVVNTKAGRLLQLYQEYGQVRGEIQWLYC